MNEAEPLTYEVRQFHLEDKGLYCLPIPKLNEAQLAFITKDLQDRGFSVQVGARLKAKMGGSSFTLSAAGLAWSSADLLDSVVPSVARVLGFPKSQSDASIYLAAKRVPGGLEVHFFPRLEGLGRWHSLRRQDECGLTPDEALVMEQLIRGTKGDIECVTDYPTEACSPMQAGKHQYYRARIYPQEFLSNLRTMSKRSSRNTYLPRSSRIRVGASSVHLDESLSERLGEWCYFDISPNAK